jgi:hypothetical protein
VLVARDLKVSQGWKMGGVVEGSEANRVETDSCSCNGTETGAEGEYPGETDFTTKA